MAVWVCVIAVGVVAILSTGVACLFVVVRVNHLRSGGTQVILRELPARGDAGWRHGVIRYGDGTVEFYRLRSVKSGPNRVLHRQEIVVEGHREPVGCERDLIEGLEIFELLDDRGRVELAMTPGAMTAFQAWLESRPDVRSQRRRKPA